LSRYTVEFKPAARKSLRSLSASDQLKIAGVIELLSENPLPPKSLKLTNRDGYRVRIGNFRILYSFNSRKLVILIIDIGARKDIYSS
jgi:mRNA interferase RelE/StbE